MRSRPCLPAVAVIAVVGLLGAACVDDQPYTCLRDAECRRGADQGTCEPTGHCSFADASCGARERRYGDLASDELRGTCVPCVSELGAGARHTCARTQRGELFCWGDNNDGQIGDGGASDVRVPTPLAADFAGAPLGRSTSLGVGTEHACSTLGDVLYCWGDNDAGELGNPDLTIAQRRPRAMVDAAGAAVSARSVAAGLAHSCAVDGSGTMSCWGDNRSSQLGMSMSVVMSTPVPQLALDRVARAVLGHDAYHSCAIRDDDSLWCWGGNDDGQVGNGTLANVTAPVPVLPGERVRTASMGNETTCAALLDGELRCWGSNTDGQLGDSSMSNRPSPAPVAGLSNVRTVAVGGRHACAIREDLSLWCWGRGVEGQLGPGTAGSTEPVEIRQGVVGVAAGASHTCIVEIDGTVRCFGANDSAQLGIGNTVATAEPTSVSLSCE